MAKPAATQSGSDSSPTAGRRRLVLGIAVVGLLAVVWFLASRFLTLAELHSRLEDVQAYAIKHPWQTALIFVAVHATVTAASVPFATAMTILAGAVFGRWLATGLVSVGATLGAVGAMLLSRFLLRDWANRKFGAQMEPIQQKINTEGRYYLFALRLTPLVPFFLINLAVGPTRMSVLNFAWVSFLGMIPATWIYANAGTALGSIDSPTDLLTPGVLISLILLGLSPLLFRWLIKLSRRQMLVGAGIGAGAFCVLALVIGWFRYRATESMDIAVREFSNAEYPEDPISRSVHFGKYSGRTLKLIQRKEGGHFDFEFTPKDPTKTPHLARIVFRDVDVRLMTPDLPEWTKDKPGIQQVALVDRQWNRQQVRFGGAGSPRVEVTGGDGFESRYIHSAELCKNELGAGRWEVLLYTLEHGDKTLLYQGWFSFPLGHYWNLFKEQTGLSYAWHAPSLEFGADLTGKPIKLEELRSVSREAEVRCSFNPEERIVAGGEQRRRRRTTVADNLLAWKDLYDGRGVRFASFVAPGRYTLNQLQGNEYDRLNQFERAVIRDIKSQADSEVRNEIELVFSSTRHPGKCRFVVSGFRWHRLPQAPVEDYPRGLYMPMGIAVPPFFQDYESLRSNPPSMSPYFCVMLDEEGRYLNHRQIGIDGPILHADPSNSNRVHLYLMSYERHTLVGHWVIDRSLPATAARPTGRVVR